MRELNIAEINEVAGSYGNGIFADAGEAIRSAILGAVAGSTAGATIGGKHGGDGGGLLGVGSIGQLVGMIISGGFGLVAGGVGGVVVGWDKTMFYTDKMLQGFLDGKVVP